MKASAHTALSILMILSAGCATTLDQAHVSPPLRQENAMALENLVAINIVDQSKYEEYRTKLAAVLGDYGAVMRCEVEVSSVLTSPDGSPFNRMFLMRFPSLQSAKEFAADNRYLSLRNELFVPSVSNTVLLGQYNVED